MLDPWWVRAGAYRRLVEHREDMLHLGHKEHTDELAEKYYPGGLAKFQADAEIIRRAVEEKDAP